MRRIFALCLWSFFVEGFEDSTIDFVTREERVKIKQGLEAFDPDDGKVQQSADRIKLIPKLPGAVNTTAFDLVTNTTDYEETLKWIYCSSKDSLIAKSPRVMAFDKWLKEVTKGVSLPTKDIVAKRVEALHESWVESSQTFRKIYLKTAHQYLKDNKDLDGKGGGFGAYNRFIEERGFDEGKDFLDFVESSEHIFVEGGEGSKRVYPPVLNDTTLVIPIGTAKIIRSFNVLESLLWSDVAPKRLMLLMGYDSFKTSDVGELVAGVTALYVLLMEYYSKSFDLEGSEIVWGTFRPRGGAAVGRWLGTHNTDTEFVIYHDNDDFLTPSSLGFRAGILRQREDIDILLNSYRSLQSADQNEMRKDQLMKDIVSSWEWKKDIRKPSDLAPTLDIKTTREHYEDAYFANSTYSFSFGSVTGWPQLIHVDNIKDLAKDSAQLRFERGLVNEIPEDPFVVPVAWSTSADPLVVLHEKEDIRYMKWANSVQSDLYPQFYHYCHNGWLAGRRDVLDLLPPTPSHFGEDAVNNYIAHSAGFNVLCFTDFAAGLYTHMSENQTEALVGKS